MVGDAAKARLVYGDGCSVQLKPQSLTTVSVASPCTVVTPAADMPPEEVVEERAFPFGPLLAVGAGVGIACLTGASCCDDDNDDNDDDDDDDDEEHE